MPRAKLTISSVEAAQPSTKLLTIQDTELTGFQLKVTPRGKKSFYLYYRTQDHQQRRPRIGDYPAIKPEQARKTAREWLSKVSAGGDPSGARLARRASRGEGSVAELFEDFKSHKAKEGRRSIREAERIFAHDILPVLGKRRAEDVTTQDVTRLIDKIASRSPSVAWAVRRQLSAFYSWAIPRLPNGTFNPVTNASRPPALKARERVLSDAELGTLWTVLEGEHEPWRTALRILILTGQRRDEVLSAEWREFDLPSRTWTISAERAKNGRAHIVPISPAVMNLLQELPKGSGRVFSGTGAAGRAAKRIHLAHGATLSWRWHDLRRTMATGMQRLGVRREVVEAILNHVSGSQAGIVGIYQRHDWAEEKRAALNAWAVEVAGIVSRVQVKP
jgi:integrase